MIMKKIPLKKLNISETAFFIAAFAFIVFVFYSDTIKMSVRNSLELCFSVIIPSLFPMLIISRIINEIKIPEFILRFIKLPMNKIFGLPENCFQAILTGLTGGYPVGVKNAASLYKNKSITLNEAQKLALFCVNPGFAFSVTLTGSCFFGNIGIGVRIFIANILADLTLAVLLKNKKSSVFRKEKTEAKTKPFTRILTDSISDSTAAIISICAWICFFSAIITIFSSFSKNTFINALIIIFSEVTNSVTFCAEHKNILLAAFCSGFSGFCIIFQLLKDLELLSLKLYSFVSARLLCGFLSVIYEWIIISLFPVSVQTVAQNIHIQLSKYSALGSASLLFLCMVFIITSSNEKLKYTSDNKT